MSALRKPRRDDLFQVEVATRSGRHLRIGPMLSTKAIAEENAALINKAVAEGRERDWRDATVISIVTVKN